MTIEALLLVEKCSHCFSTYDLASGERIASVALPDYPHEFVTDAANRFAYVGHYGVEHSGISGPGAQRIREARIGLTLPSPEPRTRVAKLSAPPGVSWASVPPAVALA